ncbi:MAG: hypothetical protein IPM96_21480 [Ignavibacteria bacterium]|nr:hypothetical protein [Ignavibacteria bacterium]
MIHDGKEKVGSFVKEAGDYFTHGKEIAGNEVSVVKEAVKSGVDSFNDERNKQKDKSKEHSNTSGSNKSKNSY